MGTPGQSSEGLHTSPKLLVDAMTVGKISAGMSNSRSSHSSHSSVWMFSRRVRDAVETSVTNDWPCVRFQISQVSSVPQHNRLSRSNAGVSGALSSSQRILLAEKYE